jgi:hypothetical protein
MPSFSRKLGVFMASACFLASSTAAAHVAFLNESGVVLMPGETVSLQWVDTIAHDTLGYDLELYIDVTAEPQSIVSGLGPEVHSYDWVVPDVVCSDCRLRVLQDNGSADYEGFLSVQIGDPVLGAGGDSGSVTTSATTTGGGDPTSSASAGGATSTSALSATVSSTTGAATTGTVATGGSTAQGTTGQPSSTTVASTQPSGGCTLMGVPDSNAWPLVTLLGLGLFASLERRRR